MEYQVRLNYIDKEKVRWDYLGTKSKSEIEGEFQVKIPKTRIGELIDITINYFLDYLRIERIV